MLRMPANRSLKMCAPTMASPATTPRVATVGRSAMPGVVEVSMEEALLLSDHRVPHRRTGGNRVGRTSCGTVAKASFQGHDPFALVQSPPAALLPRRQRDPGGGADPVARRGADLAVGRDRPDRAGNRRFRPVGILDGDPDREG